MMGRIARVVVALVVVNCIIGQAYSAQYLGKLIGKLSELHHGVSGEVYAVDGRTLYIKDFTYDGQGPAAYFYASSGKSANGAGFRLRDENGSGEVIRRYRKEGVTLTLPDGKNLRDIKIFYVWCEEFDVNFGDVKIARTLDFPRPQKIDALKGVHGISSDNIVIVDAQTLLIPNLSYDGEAPDAKFWVGRGAKPTPQGIRVPDENGKEIPLRRYDRKTVVLTLPGDLTVFDIGHFGIWCEAFTVDFGHVKIPQSANVPPSLKMLGVSPQKRPILQDIVQQVQSAPKQRVGGNDPPTTYRPPRQFDAFRRGDTVQQQPQQLINTAVYSQQQQPQYQQLAYQQNLITPQQQLLAQQRQYLLQQQQLRQLQPIQQRIDQQQQQIVPQQYYQQQLINQQQLQRQRQLQLQQQLQNQQLLQTQQQAYHPLTAQQRQYEEQLAYNQLLQRRLLEEQQLKAQLSRQHNRFNIQGNQQNAYVPFG